MWRRSEKGEEYVPLSRCAKRTGAILTDDLFLRLTFPFLPRSQEDLRPRAVRPERDFFLSLSLHKRHDRHFCWSLQSAEPFRCGVIIHI